MTDHVAHRFALGATSWSVWREALLRTTGFPASGLDRLTAPECARAADRFLVNGLGYRELRSEFDRTIQHQAEQLRVIAADPRLREAITWQNPGALVMLDAITARPPDGQRNSRRRYRERQLCRYWQRFCSKTETIGFFGPITWVKVDPSVPLLQVEAGPRLLDRRRVFIEPWALAAYGAQLAQDEQVRPWLPLAPMPHHLLVGTTLRRPGLAPVELTAAEAATLRHCDGRRPAVLVVTDLVADEATPIATMADGFRIVADLAARQLVRWDANLPVGPHTEGVLEQRIAAVGDEAARARAEAGLNRLRVARAAVGDAAGDPAALAQAIAKLGDEFTDITGRPAQRRGGQTYAGRGVCYEDTTRDLKVVVGSVVLDAIAAGLSVMLHAARWLTAEIAEAFNRELAAMLAQPRLLSQVWYPAVEILSSPASGPIEEVHTRLEEKWRTIFELDGAGGGSVHHDGAESVLRARDVFAADRPGWSAARVHSPDLHICARSVDDINAGDFTVVLGELHIAVGTLCDFAANWPKPDPSAMLAQMISDFGRPRFVPLLPLAWAQYAGRLVPSEPAPSDWNLGFARLSGVERHRTLPIEAITVELVDGRPIADLGNGERVPAVELFAHFLSNIVADSFKNVSKQQHTPRISVDRLVVFREAWRMTVADLAELTVTGDELESYLNVRRVVARHGLPERCFAKIATETKPIHVDFTSPAYAASFAAAVRAAQASAGPATTVTFTEMLPTTEQTWVPDRNGNTYFGELRLQVTDSARAL